MSEHDIDVDSSQAEAASAPVVIYRSPVTDARVVTERLRETGTPYREIQLSMGDALQRQRFHRLTASTGWSTLPQIFVAGRFVGGISEFLARNDGGLRDGDGRSSDWVELYNAGDEPAKLIWKTAIGLNWWKDLYILSNILKLKLSIIFVDRCGDPPSGHNDIPIIIIVNINDNGTIFSIKNCTPGFEMINAFWT